MSNIKLTLSYDGKNYHGWQYQSNRPTVSKTLQSAIYRLTGSSVKLSSASRTDCGVHAYGQVVNFESSSAIPINFFPKAINSYLPTDIVVYRAEEVPGNFHARFSAKFRRYRYLIERSEYPTPFNREYA